MTTMPARPALSTSPEVTDPVGWEPAGSVFCAVIVAEVPGSGPQQVVSTRWVSDGEARGFIERRLPTVVEVRAGAKVSGYVMPATTRTEMRDGELHQHVEPQWGQAQRARMNPSGFVSW